MQKLSRRTSFLILFFLASSYSFSQVSSNSFTQSTGTFTAITGGTVLWSTTFDDDLSGAITIPSFAFSCTAYTSIYISANGYISFGSAPSSNDYNPISGSGSSAGIISAFGADLNNASTGTREVRYQDVTASNEFVIQWRDVKRFSVTGERISFQIRLNYSTNTVKIIYGGTITANAATTPTVEVGLRGSSNSDFLNRTTTTNWAATTAGGTSAASCQFSGTIKPATGLTFAYAPTAMTFVSSTTAQPTTSGVQKCNIQQEILRLEVVTSGCISPMNLTQIVMNMTGSTIPGTNTNDVSLIHIYYTGNSSTFSAINAFNGAGTSVATGSITINGSQTLTSGTNYFWIAYDLNNASATVGNTVDAQCASMTVGGTLRTPTATNPAGNRSIITCVGSPGGVSSGLSVWYKADNSASIAMGTGVATWNSTAGSSGTFPVTQATAGQQPAVISGATSPKLFNYNPRLDFVAASNTYLSNTSTSPDLMTSSGSYFVISDFSVDNFTGFCYSSDMNSYRHQFKPGFRSQSSDASLNGWTFDWAAPTEYSNLSSSMTSSTGSGATQLINKNSLSVAASNSNNSTYTPIITTGLFIGRNGNGGEDTDANIAEVIMYTNTPTAANKNKIESYLALKYGITRGGNTGTSTTYNYLSSAGTTVWDKSANSGYNNDIAGIGRDDASALNQKQSISVNNNEPATVGLTTINSSNQTNSNTFSSDQTFLVWGNNGLASQVTTNPVCFANLPVGIYAHIERVWKSQNTSLSQNLTVGFETSMLVAYTPISNLRLLVDNDGVDWTNATIYTGAVINGTHVDFSGVTLNSSTPYFTLATITPLTPLPVSVIDFKATLLDDRKVQLDWETSSEINSDYFLIQRSADGINWEYVTTVPAAGNSTELLSYQTFDTKPFIGTSYYKLVQYDLNGIISSTDLAAVYLDGFGNSGISVYPNPVSNFAFIKSGSHTISEIHIYDVLGQDIRSSIPFFDKEEGVILLDMTGISPGVYTIKCGDQFIPVIKNE
nr:BNR-repeat neuraminidase N-terminal domain-containing protein [uncultured Fluviicola sp.]